MSENNLIPIANRSTEEVREIGRKGGINSGKSRRAKKSLSDRIKLALQISTNENLKSLKREIRKLWPSRNLHDQKQNLKVILAQYRVIKDCGIDVYKVLRIAEAPDSQQIGLNAANALWDREEGKPNQTTNLNHGGSITKIIHDDIK